MVHLLKNLDLNAVLESTMSAVLNFFRKKVQWVPETADQKAVIRELYKLHEHTTGIGAVEEDNEIEKNYNALAEHEENATSEGFEGDIEKQSLGSVSKESVIPSNEPYDYNKWSQIVNMDGKEVIYIKFADNDKENPYNWSSARKALCVFIMMFLTFIGGVAGASLSSGTSDMAERLDTPIEVSRLGFAIFILGFAIGPLVTSPLAEDYGRWPCYMVGIFGILIFSVPAGAAHHIAVVIIFRFIGGFVGSVASSMISGTIADIYYPINRGYPMLWHTAINFLGNVGAPVCFGYVGWLMSFRWIMWILIMACGLTMLLMFLFMEETRGQVILQTRANRLQKKYGGPNKVFLVHGKVYIPFSRMIARSLHRPILFLLTEPVVGWFSLWMGFTWGTIYICFGAVPTVMQAQYGFNPGEASLVFNAEIVGVIIGCFLDIWQQKLYQKNKEKRGPEARLYMSCAGGICCFAGIFIFGAAQGRGHWIGPCIGLAILLVGVVSIFQAISLYFADCYGTYASSALAAQSLLRNIFGFVSPLYTSYMFESRLGFTGASCLAAGVCTLLAIVPFWLLIFGKRLRKNSKYIVSDEELT